MTREEFLEIVYAELDSDADNNRANRIIEAADEYVEGAQPEQHIDLDGTLWVTVDDVSNVNRVIVDEEKSKFCKTFYQDAQYENKFQLVMREGHKEMEEVKEILKNLISEQPEPCEDAVSRQAVEKMLKNAMPEYGVWVIEGDEVKQAICEIIVDLLKDLEQLPPVTPTISKIEKVECEDCVSRKAVLDICLQYCPDDDGTCSKNGDDPREMLDEIEQLPSVTPKQRTGHWINGHCSECGEHAPFWAMASTYYESNFCPNCGAKMDEVEHDSD